MYRRWWYEIYIFFYYYINYRYYYVYYNVFCIIWILENIIIYDDNFYNLKVVKIYNIIKNINKSLLNDKGMSIGKFI